MENELLLRIKLQELQQEKQGDQRKDNLKLKQGVTQEEIDEYNKQFEDIPANIPNQPNFEVPNIQLTLTDKEVEDAYNDKQAIADELNNASKLRLQLIRDLTASKHKKVTQKIQDNLRRLKRRVEKLKQDNDAIDIALKEHYQKANENEVEVKKVEQINKQLAENFKEELRLLNVGKFNIDRDIGESDVDYVNRLTAEANKPVDKTVMNEMRELNEIKKLKTNLSYIIRKRSIIDDVVKALNDQDVIDLNKRFTRFKREYLNEYSATDLSISLNDVLEFIKTFLETDPGLSLDQSTVNQAVNQAVNQSQKGKIAYTLTRNGISILNTTDGKLYEIVKGKKAKSFLYSESGLKDSFYTLGFQSRSGKHFVTNVLGIHIKKNELEEIFKDRNINDVDDYIRPRVSDSDPKIYGWGMIDKELPKLVKFGNAQLYLNKLYTKNVLSIIRNSGMYSKIIGFPNVKVSDNFVELVLGLYNNDDNQVKNAFIKLNSNEKDLYNHMMYTVGLQKAIIGSGVDDFVDKIKERLHLIEAEIEAGNNGEQIRLELKSLLDKLVNLKAVKFTDAMNHYKRILFEYFDV